MKEIDKPIIKLFVVNGFCYIYDTYFNTILQVTHSQYNELKLASRIGVKSYISLHRTEKEYHDVCMLIRKGFLKARIIDRVENPLLQYVDQLLESCINDLVLQVTKDCNFKCRYCSFANSTGIDRPHEKAEMSWEIAKSSIDFLFRHSRDSKQVNIAFYGGEPLLNLNLIEMAVEYANATFKSKKIIYRMTTNASLLTHDVMAFLAQNRFHISLSIDGPEKIQNTHRSFRSNGAGTYPVVFKNLLMLKRCYPDYTDSHVKIMPVVVDGEDYNMILDYFYDLGFKRNQITLLNAELSGIDFRAEACDIHPNKMAIKNVALIDAANKMNGIFQSKQQIPKIWHHSGTCVPGVKRLFIDTNGIFYPCEKILIRDNLSIGNLSSGFDYQNIKRMANIGEMSETRCKRCWAMRFCEICVSQCNDIEKSELTKEQKNYACMTQEAKALWFLKHRVELTKGCES